MTNTIQKELYSASEFATMFGISKRTITRYQKKGILPLRKNSINGYIFFTIADIEAFRNFVDGRKNESATA